MMRHIFQNIGRRRIAALFFTGGIAAVTAAAAPGCGGDGDDAAAANACVSTRQLFAEQVWPIMNAKCTGCHAPGGSATTGDNPKQRAAGFVLEWDAYPDFLDVNLEQVTRMVTEEVSGVPKLLLKPTGGDTHIGGAPIPKDSPEYKLLEQLVTQIQSGGPACAATTIEPFAEVADDDWAITFRRAAILLAGRLPSAEEKAIADEGAFDKALDNLMNEPAFLKHVEESWNDVLLTDAGDRVQVGPFQFRLEDFPGMKAWQDGPGPMCTGSPDYNKCANDFYVYWSTVMRGLLHEPLALIANVVQKNAPFTEILTADYAMVNPWTAIAYNAQGDFDAPSSDNFSTWKELQVTANERGPVPHAGILSTPAFLGRWVSTETNKNRARSRMVYKAFLATDVLKLAQRPVDTAALTGVANPTRNAASCSVCHTLVDPLATSFSNYSDSAAFDYNPNITAATIPHQEMLPPGFGSERIAGQETQLLPALVDMITVDKRFSLSVARVAYKGILGREILPYPADATDPAFKDKFQAWDAQDKFLHEVADTFDAKGQNYKEVIRAIIKSHFFRAKSASMANKSLAGEVGRGRLLSPEMLDRKIEAVASIPWSIGGWGPKQERIRDLRDRYSIFYGGIDSLAVTSRLVEANPLVVNVSERMANEIACRTVAWDFTRPQGERALLPKVERDTVPGSGEAAIRDNIVYLFERALGEAHSPSDPDVEAAFSLFRDTYNELNTTANAYYLPYECLALWERTGSQVYPCGNPGDLDYNPECYSFDAAIPPERAIDHDDKYTIGAWMSVVSYIFSDVKFLYD